MATTWREATLASMVALGALPALALGGLWAPPEARHVAVLVDPASGIPAALADRVGARIVDATAVPGLWILAAPEAGLAGRLRAAGIWLVLDPAAAGCPAARAPALAATRSAHEVSS
jgi:hypothetical protein